MVLRGFDLSEPYYKTAMANYDYKLIYALGSMLGVSSPTDLLELPGMIEMEGLNAMSSGVVLAWATEMFEKSLIPLLKDLP